LKIKIYIFKICFPLSFSSALSLKSYLSRAYFLDLLQEACLDGARIELARQVKNVRQLVRLIPNCEKLFFLQREKRQELEDKFYYD
jgi:hypothetical protein